MKFVFILFLVAFSSVCLSLSAKAPVSLTFNIISHSLQNGAGKEIDVSILKEELEELGHKVNLFDYNQVQNITPADINIFLAQFVSKWFSKARLNWFIPNAEFCRAAPRDLQKMDLILCKTKECLRIFKPLNKSIYYLGFTSLDRYQSFIKKDFLHYLHVAGKSRMKGTDQVLQAWKNHPEFPYLTLIRHRQPTSNVMPNILKNVALINKRISNENLLFMQNECGVHLCPSRTEGFGHYIMEAMSTGAVVLTTDAPPMNEFITDKRCLVKYKTTSKKKYAKTYTVDDRDLARRVKALQHLSDEEMQIIGQRNREAYLRRKAEFKSRFRHLINKTAQALRNK